jgi:lipopolysaccharide exporter
MNLKGELVGTVLCLAGTTVIKLVSSIVLTSLLYPEAYGLVTAVLSVAFVVGMLSELGVVGFMIRHEQGHQPEFVHTMWTLRMFRGIFGFSVLYFGAPLIALLYDTPQMADAMRIYSVAFLVNGLESMSLVMALRDRRVNVVNVVELIALAGSTVFVIAYSYFNRDHRGMLYGMVLNRVFILLMSYGWYRDLKPRFMLDRVALKEILAFTKIVLPSSVITLAITQFDRIVFLRLFNLQLMGYYGIAGNVLAPVEVATQKISRSVLLPRCAQVHREAPEQLRDRYYGDNLKLFAFILFLPAAVGGAASLIVEILFDPRYAVVGSILMVCSVRTILSALAGPPENMLMASGQTQVLLYSQFWRAGWLLVFGFVGYLLGGFYGFLIGVMLDQLPAWLYFLYVQHKTGKLIARYEAFKLGFVLAVFGVAHLVAWSLSGYGAAMRAQLKSALLS